MQEITEQEILRRMHERVRAQKVNDQDRTNAWSLAYADGDADFDFAMLHRQLDLVHELHAAVGTINERRPGVGNSIIQFVKKLLRRLLTWYTRPLHEFHAAVTIALQQQLRVLEMLHTELMRERARMARESEEAEASRELGPGADPYRRS